MLTESCENCVHVGVCDGNKGVTDNENIGARVFLRKREAEETEKERG